MDGPAAVVAGGDGAAFKPTDNETHWWKSMEETVPECQEGYPTEGGSKSLRSSIRFFVAST